jgi:hypothetical protein
MTPAFARAAYLLVLKPAETMISTNFSSYSRIWALNTSEQNRVITKNPGSERKIFKYTKRPDAKASGPFPG